MSNLWFKFYGGEYLSDPKIERLTPLERSCWVTLLCMASMNNGVIEYLTVESLLNRSGIQYDPYYPEEWEAALSVLTKFQNMKMIKTFDDGSIELINWEKRQSYTMTAYERVKKHRENKKKLENDNEMITNDNANDNTKIKKNKIKKNKINNTDTDVAKATTSSKFVKPELKEVEEYCKERQNGIDPQHFLDYYNSNGWKVGKNPMKDWRAAIRTWERNGFNKKKTGSGKAIDLNNKEEIDKLLNNK